MELSHKLNWERLGICKDKNPEFFFPKDAKTEITNSMFCLDCPVIDQCRYYAIAHNEIGVWGGTTTSQRNRLDKQVKDWIKTAFLAKGILEIRKSLDEIYKQQRARSQERNGPTDAQALA